MSREGNGLSASRADARTICLRAQRWDLLRERRAGQTYRAVFRVDDRYLVKRFEIPLDARESVRPWFIEDACLRRLAGDGAPLPFGWFEETQGDRRIALLVREYVPGEPAGPFSETDLPAAARILARIHRLGITTDDANARNFLRTQDGNLIFLDFGRARLFERTGPWFDLYIGWELAKLWREALLFDVALWKAFKPLYFAALGCSRARRWRILGAHSLSLGLRGLRKILQGRSPRS